MAARGGVRTVRRRQLPNMVPSIFVDSNQGSEPQNMSLCDINNNMWRLKIEKFHDGWHFTDGWVKFVKDNMIKPGDVLYYESSSRGVLDFRVLGPSGREHNGVEHLEIKTAKRHAMKPEVKQRNGKRKVKVEQVRAVINIDEMPPKRRGKEKLVDHGNEIERLEMTTTLTKRRDEIVEVMTEAADEDDVDERPLGKRDEENVVDAGAGASVHGKRRKKQDFSCLEIFKSGRVPMPRNPYFVVEVRDTRVNEMKMPAKVVRAHQLELPLGMKIVDPDGRVYHTTRKSWKDGRVNYCGGWKFLRRAIGAKTGDKLICEFIRGGGDGREGEGGDLHIRVTLVPAE